MKVRKLKNKGNKDYGVSRTIHETQDGPKIVFSFVFVGKIEHTRLRHRYCYNSVVLTHRRNICGKWHEDWSKPSIISTAIYSGRSIHAALKEAAKYIKRRVDGFNKTK